LTYQCNRLSLPLTPWRMGRTDVRHVGSIAFRQVFHPIIPECIQARLNTSSKPRHKPAPRNVTTHQFVGLLHGSVSIQYRMANCYFRRVGSPCHHENPSKAGYCARHFPVTNLRKCGVYRDSSIQDDTFDFLSRLSHIVQLYLRILLNESRLIQCSFATVLQIIHNVYFRHRNIPGSFWYMATDLTYPSTLFTSSGRFNVKGLRKLQKMHAEMGNDFICSAR
jgi:hypothetical protein